jgi:hypothetical protein
MDFIFAQGQFVHWSSALFPSHPFVGMAEHILSDAANQSQGLIDFFFTHMDRGWPDIFFDEVHHL